MRVETLKNVRGTRFTGISPTETCIHERVVTQVIPSQTLWDWPSGSLGPYARADLGFHGGWVAKSCTILFFLIQ